MDTGLVLRESGCYLISGVISEDTHRSTLVDMHEIMKICSGPQMAVEDGDIFQLGPNNNAEIGSEEKERCRLNNILRVTTKLSLLRPFSKAGQIFRTRRQS